MTLNAHFAGPWLMSEDRVRQLIRRAATSDKSLWYDDDDREPKKSEGDVGYSVSAGVARIDVVGVLTKYASRWDKWFGFCPTETLRVAVEKAFADPTVTTIALVIDSPGGMVAGTVELAEYIRRRSDETEKRTLAVVSDCAMSGAYYLAAACDEITCNGAGEIGSIGVYAIYTDDSKFFEELGVNFTLVSSGGVKGLGADGKVTPELVEEARRGVLAIYERFVAWVGERRGLTAEQAKALADGRTWISEEARVRGLIDRVEPVDAAITAEKERSSKMQTEQFKKFAADNPDTLREVAQPLIDAATAAAAPKIATAKELKAAFADDPAFVMERLDVEASMADHKAAYADHLKTTLTSVRQENEQLKGKLADIDPGTAGTSPVAAAGKVEGGAGDKPPVDKNRIQQLRQYAGLPPMAD